MFCHLMKTVNLTELVCGVRFLNGACRTKVKFFGQETVVGNCIAWNYIIKS